MSDHPLLRMRRSRAMTQSRLAEACGVNVRTIRRAEQGAPLSDETVLALCAVLGCSPVNLVPGNAPTTPVAPTSSLTGSVLGAAALGAVLAALIAVTSFEIAFLYQRESMEMLAHGMPPRMTTLCRLMLADIDVAALGTLGTMAAFFAQAVPRVRASLPQRLVPGPFTMAVLCSATTPFGAAIVGCELAQGHVVQSTVQMLGVVLIPAFYSAVFVLGVPGDGALMRKVLGVAAPYLVLLGIMIQIVGFETGDMNSGAWGTCLLLPAVLRRKDLPERMRMTAIGFLMLPMLQIPYVQVFLRVAPATADVVTALCCMVADVVGVIMTLGLRDREAVQVA